MKSLHPVKSDYLKDTGALLASDTIYSGLLAASVEQTVTVPTGADFAIFNADADFWANYDLTAAIPSGTISQAGGELNPEIRYVGDITVIHVIAPTDCKIGIGFYAK